MAQIFRALFSFIFLVFLVCDLDGNEFLAFRVRPIKFEARVAIEMFEHLNSV